MARSSLCAVCIEADVENALNAYKVLAESPVTVTEWVVTIAVFSGVCIVVPVAVALYWTLVEEGRLVTQLTVTEFCVTPVKVMFEISSGAS